MLSVLVTVLIFLFTISLLVFVHEGGHFLVAKWARVWVHEFAIGFGPALWRRRRGETEYTFRALPLGGYVRMAGEDGPGEEDAHVPPERLFTAKGGWSRTAIVLAGPAMNLLAAVVLMVAYVGLFGTPYVEVSEVAAGAPAQGVLESGDKFVRLGGEEIYFPSQIQTIVQRSGGQPLEAVIDRGGKRVSVTLNPYWSETRGQYLIGVYFTLPLTRITRAPEGSELARVGLREGDLVLSVDGAPVATGPEVVRALSQAAPAGEVVLRVRRGGEVVRLSLVPAELDLEALRRAFAGLRLPATRPVVERVRPGSLWAERGIRPGDRLVFADGEPIPSWVNLIKALRRAQTGDGRLALTVERDGERRELLLNVQNLELEEALTALELRPAQRMPASLWASVALGARQVGNVLVVTYLGIKQVIAGQVSAGDAFVGPVGIADLLGRSLDLGVDYLVRLVAILSLMLGIFNLLPFPALDGSRIAFIAVNGVLKLIVGRPIPPEKEGWIHYIGFMLLMVLILVITWNDIQRLFQGGGF